MLIHNTLNKTWYTIDGWTPELMENDEVIPQEFELDFIRFFPFITVTHNEEGDVVNIAEDAAARAAYEAQLPIPVPPIDLETEINTLKAKLLAASEANAFLEECIVEMAGIVYA